jgi:hypothetical protein
MIYFRSVFIGVLWVACGTVFGDSTSPPWEPLGPCSRRTGLAISEIMYRPPPRTDGRNLEYVELYNSQPLPENIGGFRLAGDIQFAFPPDTLLPAGAFLIVAKSPADFQTVYSFTNVWGPYVGNLPASGSIRLLSPANAVFLEVNYANQPPWPIAADGAGHSLVLARPSYGENNPAAWSASELVGGSPGTVKTRSADPLRSVVINEYLAHAEPPLNDFIELYNHSPRPADVSGCTLSDHPQTNKFIIPAGTVIPAAGFVCFEAPQLGFRLKAAGETIYLKNPDATCVLDSVRYEAQENGVTVGRYPDGANEFYRLKARTPGAANREILVSEVVINEIMYHPISGDDDDQYVELYNRGGRAIDLGRWRFVSGIDFEFPIGTVLAPQGYVVVARNARRLMSRYANLNSLNTVGDFGKRLAHGGERVALAEPHPVVAANSDGAVTTNWTYVVVDEVTYGTGGRWGQWAAEGGCSLELIDAHSNHRMAANWADSDETTKGDWLDVEQTGVLDNGLNNYPVALQLLLEGEGECLVDDVAVIGTGGTNLVANSTFEDGVGGWFLLGTHDQSTWETGTGYGGGSCLHVRATGRGDTGANTIRTPLLAISTLRPGTKATLRAKVRWLKGCPQILFRLRGNRLEAAVDLAVPTDLGTPGMRNSRAVSNAGPAIYAVRHAPVLPKANEPVVVTARVEDPEGVAQAIVKYRLDPSTNHCSVPMVDDGTGADEVARDGLYTATIPGLAAGELAAFVIQAIDQANPGVTAQFPATAPEQECLVRFGEPFPSGSFPVYHIWTTQTTLTNWANRLILHNGSLDATFVYGNQRAVYNIGVCDAGSPFIRLYYTGPDHEECGYSLTFPNDDLFFGVTDVALDWPVRDETQQAEQIACWMARELGIPFNYRRFTHLFVNGQRRGQIYEDAQRPNADFLEEWSAGDTHGDFFKIDDWFEFPDDFSGFINMNTTLQNFTTAGGVKKLARYRWNWRKRAGTTNKGYDELFALVDALNVPRGDAYTTNVEQMVDVEEWMRTFCLEHAVGNFDSYGYLRGKNMYAYKPDHGKWTMLPWDIDWVLGAGGIPVFTNLFEANDPTITQMYQHPPFRRAYFRAMDDLANGPFLEGKVNPLIDAWDAVLRQNGVAASAPTAVKAYIQKSRALLLQQLKTVEANFAITSNNGQDFSVQTNLVVLTGTAPVEIRTIEVNGGTYPVTWTTVKNWTLRLPLNTGNHLLTLRGYDRWGHPYTTAAPSITVTVPTPGAANGTAPVITGISAAPDGSVSIVWSSDSGTTYQVRYKPSLEVPGWTNLGPILTATSATTSFTDRRGQATQRYYQILRLAGR